MRHFIRSLAVVAALSAASNPSFGQSDTAGYPNRVVKIVHQYTAGGGNDYLARIAANGLSERWGQSVIVEPRPGGGGIIGADAVAKAAPDGYTILMGAVATHAINPYLYASMPYDAVANPIIASLGTPEGDDPGTLLSPAAAQVNIALSHDIGSQAKTRVGVRVQNLFGNYTPVLIPPNLFYVPQGIGGYGPGSGTNTNACAPGQTFGCEPFMYNQSVYPYENEPGGPPRVYTFFISTKY